MKGLNSLHPCKRTLRTNIKVIISTQMTMKLPFILAVSSLVIGLCIGAVISLDSTLREATNKQSSTAPVNTRPLLDGADEWRYIFSTNLIVSFKMLFGILTLGMIGMVSLCWTGINLSWVLLSAYESGVSLYAIAALILPHGVVELAGFVFFGAVGCEGLVLFYQKLRHDTWLIDSNRLAVNVRRLVTGFLLISAASIIEAFVTGQIAAKIN
ncbi:MAG: stage II sporulation protein M [Gemmatimonadetes bacterium]|nr:stage II sporulation protein M [Gemmatimonadota bacterium]MYH19095.1 stage II sporulation protein M [Gemmatimonadota bacterium]